MKPALFIRPLIAFLSLGFVLPAFANLIPNGTLEVANDEGDWPARWPRPTSGCTWEKDPETDNHFFRLAASDPGKMTLLYTRYPIPAGAKALELSWKQRVTGLKRGTALWHDARVMIEFIDAAEQRITTGPNAKPKHPFSNRDTDGWVDRKTRFLVPENAATVVFMFSLFEVKSGVFDFDNILLTPPDTVELEAAAAARAALEKARHIPAEAPDQSKWPQSLRVFGNKILNADGNPVLLRGLSTSGMETLANDLQGPKSLVVAVEEWKANIMRLPVRDDFWFGRDASQKDGGEAYRAQVDKILTLAANRGAYLLIDLHRFRAPRAEHAEFWTDVATRYKNHPAAIFDIFNEPHGMSWEIWRNGGFIGEKLKPGDEDAFLSKEELIKLNKGFESVGMQALVKAVRDTGAKNLILASGLAWSYDLTGITNGYALDDLDGNGIVYAWHAYNWHTGWAGKVLDAAKHHPILVAEFGADIKKMNFIPLASQEDPYTWVPDMLGFIQQNGFHYTAWCFHPASTPVLISDWNYTPTPFWGALAKRALAGEQFEMKRMR